MVETCTKALAISYIENHNTLACVIVDTHFSEKNNDELVKFCKGTGLRRCELSSIKGGDIITKTEIEAEITKLESIPEDKRTAADEKQLGILKDTRYFEEEYYVHIRKGIGKGGRERYSPIIGEHQKQIADRIIKTPEEKKVWEPVPPFAAWNPLSESEKIT